MLTSEEVIDETARLWKLHVEEMPQWEHIRGYSLGKLGKPDVPAGSDSELRDLATMSVKNVMPLVVDSFVQNLSVVGFRSPDASQDSPVWSIWQREHLDARQSEAHRPAVTYGASYARMSLEGGQTQFYFRTPRQIIAIYDDPTQDEWPIMALETWMETSANGKKIRRGILFDTEYQYPVTIHGQSRSSRVEVGGEDAAPHGFDVCPVVRFINDRDAEDMVRGEVEPLITEQQAINNVNFDRLIVSRFGAFPQKYVMGWAPDDPSTLRRMSAKDVWAFDDPDVKAGAFPSANVTAYNSILDEMISHVAVKARVPVFALTGDISNVGAETIALIDSPNQRKVKSKRESFGESWEQMLRKAAQVEGSDVDDSAEAIWYDTEARSFAQVVDGIVKLVSAGVPVASVLDQIPGLSQVKIDAIVDATRREQATGLAAQVITAARSSQTPTEA